MDHPNLANKMAMSPLPWAVHYSILHLFILKDGQVDLNPKAPSQMCWSVTAVGCSHHCQVFIASITSSIRTSTPWRGLASGRTSRNPWCSLLLVSSTTSSWALSTGITGPSHLPIRCYLAQVSHPNIYITGTSQGLDGSPWPLGDTLGPWPPFSSPWQHLEWLDCLSALYLQSLLLVLFSWPN